MILCISVFNNMSKFQNGGMRGKGVVYNLFLLRCVKAWVFSQKRFSSIKSLLPS